MADAVLVYPKTGMDEKSWACCLPLSVLHLASVAVKEFDLKIIDQRLDYNWRDTLASFISDKTLCVGISSMTGKQIYYGLEVSKFVKTINKSIPIVWGGVHPTLMPEQTIENHNIDYLIAGEGEFSFLELLRRLTGKRSIGSVPGLVWKEEEKIKSNPSVCNFDLDDLPEVPYYLVDMEKYISPTLYTYNLAKRLLPYFSSRGCPYRCIFCSQAAIYKSQYRKMSPENVYQGISKLISDYSLDFVDFYDDEFATDSKWITRVAELIKGRFIWSCQARMDDLMRLDLEGLANNGLRVVKVGLESGSNRILEYLKKRESVEIYVEVNRRLAAAGIISQYNFMIGYPNETKEDLFATVDLALKLMEDNPRALINSFSLLTIYPGTELLRIVEQGNYNLELPTTLEGWADINRQNITTPWANEKKELYLYLQYSSHFLSSAKRYASKYKFFPKFIFDLYSGYLKKVYKRKKFGHRFDFYLLKLFFKYILKV